MADHSGHRGRHRERILLSLHKTLDKPTDKELLELVLYAVNPRSDTRSLAQTLLKEYGGLAGIFDQTLSELCRVRGAGENTALLLALMGELSRRTQWSFAPAKRITGPESAFDYIKPRLEGLARDVSFFICLNHDFKSVRLSAAESPLTCEAMFEFARKAILAHSRLVIFFHASPGKEAVRDEAELQGVLEMSKSLGQAGIVLLDFISCATDTYLSAARDGLFPVREPKRDEYCPSEKRPQLPVFFPTALPKKEGYW